MNRVERVATVLRREIDILLADYCGDLTFIEANEDGKQSPEQRARARSRLEALLWLRGLWFGKPATTSEERLEGIAAEVIRQAGTITPAMEDAGWKVLDRSGYLEAADSGARLLPRQVFEAMWRDAQS